MGGGGGGQERGDLRGPRARVGRALGLVVGQGVGRVGELARLVPAEVPGDHREQAELQPGAGLIDPDRLDRVQPRGQPADPAFSIRTPRSGWAKLIVRFPIGGSSCGWPGGA